MTLPLVLAGPIVRRVDGRFCSFWVALRAPATVTAHVWPGIQKSKAIGAVDTDDPLVATGSAPTVRFGANFFVAVVTARARASLQPGSIFSYDLSFKPLDGSFAETHLRSEKLLTDEPASPRLAGVDHEAPRHLALGYLPGQLPSFVTPAATIADLRIAHASCRNPNADGADAMGFLDHEVETHIADAAARLQQLFLTGDQVYADDVPRTMLKMVTELGIELVGGVGEQLPIGGKQIKLTLQNFPTHRRLRLVREEGQLTTTDGDSHMLGFGEFAALHLLAWSPRLWRSLATVQQVYTDAAGSEVFDRLTDWEKCYAAKPGRPPVEGWRDYETTVRGGASESSFRHDTGRVEVYRLSVPKMARLLANCATYMMFDDHEVTDDWNLNKRWRNRVITSALGRAILRNGMMAYTVCQGWGNDPRAFTRADVSIFDPADGVPEPPATLPIWAQTKPETDPSKLTNNGSLLKLIHDAFEGTAPYPTAAAVGPLDILLGLNNPDPAVQTDKKAVFNYAIDGSKHRVVVLDTRTHRSYRDEGQSPPSLLGPTLDAQLPKGPLGGDRELLIVLVPVPVLGPSLIHDVAQPVAAMAQDVNVTIFAKAEYDPCAPGRPLTGAEKRDVEGWNGDEVALEAFLERLSSYPSVVLLSGDVHFASSAMLDYWVAGRADAISRIVQLTSSGARNHGPASLRPLVRGLPFAQGLLRGVPQARLAWKGEAAIDLPSGARITLGRRARMLRKPALVPASGWPHGTTITTPADWRWRAQVLRDDRPHRDLPVTYPFQEPGTDPTPGIDIRETLALIAARHAAAAMTRKDQMRVVVFATNAAIVSFRAVGDGVHVRHTHFSEATPGSSLGAANTLHECALRPLANDAGPLLETD